MQITLNQAEVSQVVLEYIQEQLALDDSNNFVIELHEDGITILVNEDSNTSTGQASTGDKPAKKPRRTKAQIEADAKAEAERLAAEAGKSQDTPIIPTSAHDVKPTVAAQAGAAGDTTPEASASLGSDTQQTIGPVDEETPVDPQTEVAATVVVEEPANEPEPQVDQQPEPEVETQPKPTQSLFANLRRPKNA